MSKNDNKTATTQNSESEKLQAALARIAELEQTVERVKAAKTQKKEFSIYFCNENGEKKKAGNMSETIGFLENNHPDIVEEIIRSMGKTPATELVKVGDFHKALAKRLSQ